MNAFIYAGGEILAENVTEQPEADDLIIAADSGYDTARRLGVSPAILVGDFDSIDGSPERLSDSAEIYRLPKEKDVTDLQYAVDLALSKGADTITVIGGIGTRADHTLSSLAILEKLHKAHKRGVIVNGYNRVRFLQDDSTILIRSPYRYFSILAIDEILRGVTVEGGKYPLSHAKLQRENQFAVSNEITKNAAFISIRKGRALIIESRD